MALLYHLSKSRSPLTLFRSISTLPHLNQQPLPLPIPTPTFNSITPLPPNPTSQPNKPTWPSPPPPTHEPNSLLITQHYNLYQTQTFLSQHQDPTSLKALFADYITRKRFDEIVSVFLQWVHCSNPNNSTSYVPDVALCNYYLRALVMLKTPPEELVDFVDNMVANGLSPDTASFNLVLKGMAYVRASKAAQNVIDRMLQSGKDAQPDDESYNLVIHILFMNDQIDDALKYVDLSLNSGYMLETRVFSECVRSCLEQRRLDTLVLVIEKCKAMEQNKNLCPTWKLCCELADAAIANDHSKLTFLSLTFMAKWIAGGQKATPPIYFPVDEGLVVSVISTAARTLDSKLMDASWAVLKRSLRDKKKPRPETYLAKISALASSGTLERAFVTLNELETVHGSSVEAEDLFSPFTSLYPLVVACCKKGSETLDSVYFQLENLSKAEPPFKSVAALNCIILGCANIWDIDRAYQTFEAISPTFGLTPNIHSYNALLYAFGKLQKTPEAANVFEHACSTGIKPNDMSYNLLADAHLVNRDPKSALDVVNAMVQAGFEPSRETLKKIRRRCIREMDNDCDDQVESLARQFKINMGTENRRNILFNLRFDTEYGLNQI